MSSRALSWSLAEERAERALRLGKLSPIPTRVERIVEDGIPFIVRVLTNPARDAQEGPPAYERQEDRPNPFLPYDPDLFVAPVTSTHVCLLNKYYVLPHHLLLITTRFERQDAWLTAADFEALWVALRAWNGLVFYNAGRLAGASQPHKHLQLVPLPLAPEEPAIPIAFAFTGAKIGHGIQASPRLPYAHAVGPVDPAWLDDPVTGAAGAVALLTAMRVTLGLERGFVPHNLLVTRAWLMLIPRSRAGLDGISVNAVGFSGGLLVRDEATLTRLRALGPLTLLSRVGRPVVTLEGS